MVSAAVWNDGRTLCLLPVGATYVCVEISEHIFEKGSRFAKQYGLWSFGSPNMCVVNFTKICCAFQKKVLILYNFLPYDSLIIMYDGGSISAWLFKSNKCFLIKSNFILQCSHLLTLYTSSNVSPIFVSQKIRFLEVLKICNCLWDDFIVGIKSLSDKPFLKVGKQEIVTRG